MVGLFLLILLIIEKYLGQLCKPNAYYDSDENKCFPCHDNCNICSGPSENNCTGCRSTWFMLAPSENEKIFKCVQTCSYTSEPLKDKRYRFCPTNPPSTAITSTTNILTTTFLTATSLKTLPSTTNSTSLPSENNPVIHFTAIFALFFLLSMIFTIGFVFYYFKKKEKGFRSINIESIPLTTFSNRELKSIPLSSLNWEEKKEIGRGRFGRVYRCHCIDSGEDVAVKELIHKEQSIHMRFHQELGIMCGLQHPNVTEILGFNYTDRLMIITSLRKCDLAKYLAPLNTIECVDLIRFCCEITDAMIYLHSKNIIHCDLKANNILVKDKFTIEVADFGLAGVMGDSNGIGGTITHAPLEYLTREAKHPTKEGDIWSFGVTVWEIFVLCKERPYSEEKIRNECNMRDVLSNGTKLKQPARLQDGSLWSTIISCNVIFTYTTIIE